MTHLITNHSNFGMSVLGRERPAAISIEIKSIDDTSNFDEFPESDILKPTGNTTNSPYCCLTSALFPPSFGVMFTDQCRGRGEELQVFGFLVSISGALLGSSETVSRGRWIHTPGLSLPSGWVGHKDLLLVGVYYRKVWVTWNNRNGKINRFKYIWKK